MARLGGVIVLVTVLAAVFGPWLAPFDPASQELALRLEGPTGAHWFGLDELGRDIFARVLSGARISLLVGLVVVSVSSFVGIVLGSIAGYYGGRIDEAISRVVDILLAFPGLLLAIAILTDALIVRMTLVPALLTLLGEKSWYIPRWLDRLLPNVTIEPPHHAGTELRPDLAHPAEAAGR